MKKLLLFFVSVIASAGFVNAQWQQMGGPLHCEIDALVVSGSTIFAGTHRGVVSVSADTGRTWNDSSMPVTFSLDADDTALYTAIDNLVCISEDNGASYTTINTGLPDDCNAYFIEVMGKIIFVHTENNGTVVSQDRGAHWSPTVLPFGVRCFLQVEQNIFAGTGDGIYMSADSGLTWDLAGLAGKYITALVAKDASILAGTGTYGIYSSDNGGQSWLPSDAGITDSSITSIILKDDELFAATTGGSIFISGNEAASWEEVSIGLPDGLYVSCLASLGNKIFAGTSSCGLFLSIDNGSLWTHAANGPGTPANVISITEKGGNIVAGTNLSGIYTSGNGGTDWFISDLVHGIYALIGNGPDLYAGTTNGLYRSADNGLTWTLIGLQGTWIPAVAILDGTIFAGTEHGVFASDNNGSTWSEVNNGIPENTHIYCFAVNGTRLFAGSYESGVYVSTDNGSSWTSASEGLSYNFVKSLYADGENIFAGNWWYGVYLSTDNGVTWNPSGLENECVNAFVKSGNTLFAGTWEHGVFVSYDHGVSWNEWNTGLTNTVVESLVIDGNYLYAGIGNQGGVWKRSLSDVVGTREYDVPVKIRVYPNPAGNEICIEQTLPGQDVVASIFNSDGRLIITKELADCNTKIDISALNEGLYLIRINDDDATETIKFIKK